MTDKLNVFISWSGEESRYVAEVLAKWIGSIIQSSKTWISSRDIQSGARWSNEVSAQLEQTHFAIVCVTPSNKDSPWLHFEAGAASKKLQESYIVPYLIGIRNSDVKPPLSLFHMENADREGTLKLFKSVAQVAGTSLDEELFDSIWPKIENGIEERPQEHAATHEDATEISRETLVIVRDLATSIDEIRASLEQKSSPDADIPFEQRIMGRMMETFLMKGFEDPEAMTKMLSAMETLKNKGKPQTPSPSPSLRRKR